MEKCGKVWKLRRNLEVSICEVLEETEFGGKYEVILILFMVMVCF